MQSASSTSLQSVAAAPALSPAQAAIYQMAVNTTTPPQPARHPPPTTAKEMTLEEKTAAWNERIRLSALAVTERLEIEKLERKIIELRRQVESSAYQALGPEVRATVTTELANTVAKSQEKKESLNGLITKLVESGFWPVLSPHNLENLDGKLKDMRESLSGLHDGVSQLQSSLTKVAAQHLRRQGVVVLTGESTPMDVDAEGGSSRPAKRRRMSDSSQEPRDDLAAGMQEAIEKLHDRIRSIDDRVLELDNNLTQHSRDVLEDFEGRLDAKVDEIKGMDDTGAAPSDQIGQQAAEQLKVLQDRYEESGNDITELAKEIADLIGKLNESKEENERLAKENQAIKETIVEHEAKMAEQNVALATTRREIRALSETVAAIAAAPLSQPSYPSLEVIAQAMERPIIRTAREHVEPLLRQFRTDTEELLRLQSLEIQTHVRPKLLHSAKMATLFMKYIEQLDPSGAEALVHEAAAPSS
ncbi:hypothetical protein BV25DRAFT_1916182 [Artomyces pyxidatus]|uniref:Uncharacterized protein n=1 Tax=Artomyces pyxidatus TaxID=48021 RepID=A0ACB8T0S0_9AGAM|nr:hypothetical protein BV25DRAFT_1916182 [Artomyces pyxidatus]